MISGIKNNKGNQNLGTTQSSKTFHHSKTLNMKNNYSAVAAFDSHTVESLITQAKIEKEEEQDLDKLKNLTNIEEIKDYYEYTENCMHLISKLKMPPLEEIAHLQLDLPEKLLKKKLAIFDLDETLIHCELKNPTKADKIISIKLPNGEKAKVRIFKFRLV